MFSVFGCGEKVSAAVEFHMNFGPRAKQSGMLLGDTGMMVSAAALFGWGIPLAIPFSVLITSAKLWNCVDFVRERLAEEKQGKRYGSGMVKASRRFFI